MIRLTDKKAIGVALRLARDYEFSLVDAWSNDDSEQSVVDAKKRIRAFERVLNRYYPGWDGEEKRLAQLPSVSIYELMNTK